MKLAIRSISQSLSPAVKAFRPTRDAFEKFAAAFQTYLERIDSGETEENLKTHLMDFLKVGFLPTHLIEQQGRTDFVIRVGGKATPCAVLFEAKREANRADMISVSDCNKKALHEIVLYYMKQRCEGNTDIQKLIICTEHRFFVFDAKEYERLFFNNTEFRKSYQAWAAGKKTDSTTDFFYTQIAWPFIASSDAELLATFFDLRDFIDQPPNSFLQLYKVLSPQNLLKEGLANDSNNLNSAFYDELLYIVGLKESKDGGKRLICRFPEEEASPASLIENTIARLRYHDEFNGADLILEYGPNSEERAFSIALELCLTWITRLLFLKLLEAQIVKFHGGDSSYKYLNIGMVANFNELTDLFFAVLAFKKSERQDSLRSKYARVPYLNSSLFEKTRLERLVSLSDLSGTQTLPCFHKTVLRTSDGRRREGSLRVLAYLFDFLDAYDFGAVGTGNLREESKTIINAAVLGLIFEKINGYKEGAIFTPGYVTMYMSRMVIERAVLEAFARIYPDWRLGDLDDLKNHITDRSKSSILKMNAVIDGLRICDPAVGSGHFLVSCLNELIAIKSRLEILADRQGSRLTGYAIEVDNDELIILNADSDDLFSYRVIDGVVPSKLQRVQEVIFHEKEKLIENCLFGVDINANSVRICQLRLWIELLKSTYYRDGREGDFETLPNIDINIKCGNSLLSRSKLDQSLSEAFNRAGLTVAEYRDIVAEYKSTRERHLKRDLEAKIESAKARFQAEALGNQVKRINAELAELRFKEAQLDLFVFGEAEQADQTRKLKEVQIQIKNLETRRQKIEFDRTFMSAFEWRFEFPEVLDDAGGFQGFDVIIANPPYMRIQEIEATQPLQKQYYEQNYLTARGSFDLANLFFELAVNLSRNEGNQNIFIFPHKLFNSDNGASLREYLTNQRAMKHITHFGANQVFDSAITYTCIALFNSRATDSFRFKRFALGEKFQTELSNENLYTVIGYDQIASASGLYGDNQWIFFDEPEEYRCFEKLYENSMPLSESLDVFVGLQTSRDSLYVARKVAETDDFFTILVNPDGRTDKPLVPTREFEVEKKLFRPFLLGKDVHRYQTLKTDRLVFFPYEIDGQAKLVRIEHLERNYPKTFDFVMANRNCFESREKGRAKKLKEWYAYIYEKNLVRFDQEKLTSMEICVGSPNITLNPDHIYHSTTVYSLCRIGSSVIPYEFFAGVLNSRLFWWFLKSTGDTLQGDARRMKTNYVNPFPLPRHVSDFHIANISGLVRTIVAKKAGNAEEREINEIEGDINNAVYALYGFERNDVEAIERALGRGNPALPYDGA